MAVRVSPEWTTYFAIIGSLLDGGSLAEGRLDAGSVTRQHRQSSWLTQHIPLRHRAHVRDRVPNNDGPALDSRFRHEESESPPLRR